MPSELEQLKQQIEGGESCVYAYEQVDLEKMRKEGDAAVATKIETVLQLVGEINDTAGID